jgi:VanZ family protein
MSSPPVMQQPPGRLPFYILPVFLYGALIFYLSSLAQLPVDLPAYPGFDKILHFLEYAVFGYLIMRLCRTSPHPSLARQAIPVTIVTGLIYGISDEWHQSFVPGRDASAGDVLSDLLGAAMAAVLFTALRQRVRPLKWIEDWIEREVASS